MELINSERKDYLDGKAEDEAMEQREETIDCLVQMLIEVGVYKTKFEPEFLKTTG